MRLSDGELRWMQARLAQRYAAAGRDAQEKLERQLAVLAPDQALLTSWCYAASPLSDWANYDFSLLGPARRTRCIYGNSRQVFVRFRSSCFSIMSSIRASMRRNSAIAEAFLRAAGRKNPRPFCM